MNKDQIISILTQIDMKTDGKFVSLHTIDGQTFRGYIWEPESHSFPDLYYLRLDNPYGSVTSFVDMEAVIAIEGAISSNEDEDLSS